MLNFKQALAGARREAIPHDEPHEKNKITHIGIDLGTVNTIVYISGSGIVFNEPSVVAFDTKTKDIIAVGHAAKNMIGKTHSKIKVIRPLTHGAVSDKTAARAFLETIINSSIRGEISKSRATVLICCHADLSTIERKALKELASSFGINDVLVEEEVKAGAIGMGIDIFKATGTLVIDIGGGSTDIGVLSLGDLVVSQSIKLAGETFDNEIVKFMKFKKNFEIGPSTAEEVKKQLATLKKELPNDITMDVMGRDLKHGLPSTITVKQSEIRDVLNKSFNVIVGEVFKVLESCPPEISSDIIDDGVHINGGGSLIDGVKEFFEEALGLPVTLSTQPLQSIAMGTKVLLKNRGNYLIKPYD